MKPIVQNTQGGLAVIGEGDTLEVDALLVDQSPVVTTDDMVVLSASYAEIKALRDAGKLIPGNVYEITDYETIYVQPVTGLVRSDSSNLFNVRLLAIGPNRFAPEAWAASTDRTQPEGSVITASTPLDQWRLLYDFDNDSNLYDWATPSGKGVIYRLRDHRGNDSPFDHYNIKFRRYEITATTTVAVSLVGKFAAPETAISGFTINETSFEEYLTFNFSNDIRDNGIERSATGSKVSLPNVVVRGYATGVRLGCRANNITILGNCSKLATGGNCRDFIVGGDCLINGIGGDFYFNYIGGNFNWNTIGNNCHHVVCNLTFVANSVGNAVYNINVSGYCNYSTISGYCYDNSFTWIYGCNIGNWCSGLTFSGVLRRVTLAPVVQNKDFTGFDIYNKTYNQTIQINSGGSAVSRWLNASNVEQFTILI